MKNSVIPENKFLKKIAAVLFWLLLWQILAALIGREILFVSPAAALKKLLELAGTSAYWLSIGSSLYKIIIGLTLSVLFGVALSVVCFFSAYAKELIYPVILFLKSVPVAGFVILLLMWIDSARLSVYISFFMGMPLIFENVYEGLSSADKSLIEMADSFEVPILKRLRYIYRIKAAPYLRAGIISVSGLAFKAGIAAEVIGLQRDSIGENLLNAKIYLDMAELAAWIITILALSALMQKGVKALLGGNNA